jgi:hypothetical protein
MGEREGMRMRVFEEVECVIDREQVNASVSYSGAQGATRWRALVHDIISSLEEGQLTDGLP